MGDESTGLDGKDNIFRCNVTPPGQGAVLLRSEEEQKSGKFACCFSIPILLTSAHPDFVMAKRRDDRLSPSSRQQICAQYGNRLAADQDTIIPQADAQGAPPR